MKRSIAATIVLGAALFPLAALAAPGATLTKSRPVAGQPVVAESLLSFEKGQPPSGWWVQFEAARSIDEALKQLEAPGDAKLNYGLRILNRKWDYDVSPVYFGFDSQRAPGAVAGAAMFSVAVDAKGRKQRAWTLSLDDPKVREALEALRPGEYEAEATVELGYNKGSRYWDARQAKWLTSYVYHSAPIANGSFKLHVTPLPPPPPRPDASPSTEEQAQPQFKWPWEK